MITSKWNGRNAREEIYDFVDHLNIEMPRRNEFDKDFVLRSALIGSDLDCAYKVGNFTLQNLCIIERDWERIQSAIVRTVNLVNRFGLDRDTLTSVNALMPIIYYQSRTKSDLMGSTDFDVMNSERVRIWLTAALLGNAFGGAVNATLALARKMVREGMEDAADFPLPKLAEGLRLRGRRIDFDEQALSSVLDISYVQRPCYLTLSLLYDQSALSMGELHIDHIFPRSLFDYRKLRDRGLGEAFGERCRLLLDKVGNLQLLAARENAEKSDLEFHQWMDMRSESFVETHLIPKNSALWPVERFPEFVEERSRLIRDKLRTSLRPVAAQAPFDRREERGLSFPALQ